MEAAKNTINRLLGSDKETEETGTTTSTTTSTTTPHHGEHHSTGPTETQHGTGVTGGQQSADTGTTHDIVTSDQGPQDQYKYDQGVHGQSTQGQGFSGQGTREDGQGIHDHSTHGQGTHDLSTQGEGVHDQGTHNHGLKEKLATHGSHHSHSDDTSNTGTGDDHGGLQNPSQGRDPAVVDDTSSRKLTGTGEPGSHSAVFGLTPDGKQHTDTSHHTTRIQPAHSNETTISKKSVSDTNDTSSRAPTGAGIRDQMDSADTDEPKGLQRKEPMDTAQSSDGKPGAGLVGGEQGSGQVGQY